MPFNSGVVFVPSPILHQKYLPLHHNTSGPGRKYMCFLPSFISVSTFFFSPLSMCAESSYTNVMQQNSDVSVCPAVIVLSVHILKDIVLNGAACCWLGCRSILNRAFKFLMIIEITVSLSIPQAHGIAVWGLFTQAVTTFVLYLSA